MELFSKSELIIMVSVFAFILFMIIVLTILDSIDERKNKKKDNNIDDDNDKKDSKKEDLVIENEIIKEDVEILELAKLEEKEIEVEEIKEEKESLDLILDLDEEVSFETNEVNVEVSNTKEDSLEVQVVESTPNNIELEVEEISPKKIECEDEKKDLYNELVKLEQQLSTTNDMESTITNFELFQEENAIISYDELLKVSDKIYNDNEFCQYDEGNEPITIDEVIKRFKNNEMVFENTADYDKLNREIHKDGELIEEYKSE